MQLHLREIYIVGPVSGLGVFNVTTVFVLGLRKADTQKTAKIT
jgi:hypothetical protein